MDSNIFDHFDIAMIWFAIGIILLICEVLGTAGFLLGAAVAALIMGVVMLIFPSIQLSVQLLMYAISSTVMTLFYFKSLRAHWQQTTSTLETPAEQLIGRQFILDQSIAKNQEVSIQLSSTRWMVIARSSLNKGDMVKVVGADTQRLEIDHVAAD